VQAGLTSLKPQTARSADGRLWFVNGHLLQELDPNHLLKNHIAPPVNIERIVADRREYVLQEPALSLPALTRDLQIDYTALSFVAPQKVQFRYKLEGHDRDWQDAGTRRQAFYNDLGPGNYKFRVIACNNDGVWNEQGAALAFRVAPAWYQTSLFRILVVVACVFMALTLYRLRIRQVSHAMSARFDVRLAERTRIARELHDTFLQTIQGSKLLAEDALDHSEDPDRMRGVMKQLAKWLDRAAQEGRAALVSLRTSTTETNDLAEALRRATENGFASGSVSVNFSVIGSAREMHPIVRDEVYRIGYEAIRNAYVHSRASQLDIELRYSRDLTVSIKDNGVGIDPEIASAGKGGHFGLQGMRERAARIGGKLEITSSNNGTDISIVVPGSLVFRKQDRPQSKD
jgi:signal transduction histidine kinase